MFIAFVLGNSFSPNFDYRLVLNSLIDAIFYGILWGALHTWAGFNGSVAFILVTTLMNDYFKHILFVIEQFFLGEVEIKSTNWF